MARATVSRRDFEAGRLPAMCVRTGEPADTLVEVKVVALPSGDVSALAVLIGGLGGWLALYSRQVRGYLPMTGAAAREQRLLRRVRAVAFLTIFVALFVSIYEPVAFVIAVLMLVTFVVTLLVGLRVEVTGRTEDGGETVTLSPVHPRFAELVRARPSTGTLP